MSGYESVVDGGWAPAEKVFKTLRLTQKLTTLDQRRLIVLRPYQNDRDYANAYFNSAERLAATFTSEPIDDLILIPFLMLFRHGMELQLKNAVRELISLRKTYLGHSGERLEWDALSERLVGKHSHRLEPVLNEVREHWDALDVSEDFPNDVVELVTMLHEADKSGQAFRYAGALTEHAAYIDFPALVEFLVDRKGRLYAAIDYITEGYYAMPTLDDLM